MIKKFFMNFVVKKVERCSYYDWTARIILCFSDVCSAVGVLIVFDSQTLYAFNIVDSLFRLAWGVDYIWNCIFFTKCEKS